MRILLALIFAILGTSVFARGVIQYECTDPDHDPKHMGTNLEALKRNYHCKSFIAKAMGLDDSIVQVVSSSESLTTDTLNTRVIGVGEVWKTGTGSKTIFAVASTQDGLNEAFNAFNNTTSPILEDKIARYSVSPDLLKAKLDLEKRTLERTNMSEDEKRRLLFFDQKQNRFGSFHLKGK